MKGITIQMNSQSANNIVTQIKELYDTLSKSQKKVAELILRQGVDATYLSAAEIAALVGVDPSTVIRTAQALGYKGFPDLQNALRSKFIKQTDMGDRLGAASQQLSEDLAKQAREQGTQSILASVVRSEYRHLGDLLHQVTEAQLEMVAEKIDKARKVHILGTRYSAPIAQMLATLVSLVRPDCTLMDSNPTNLAVQLDDLRADDVLFVFAFHPIVRGTSRCMTYAQTIGVPIILMTDTPISSVVIHADLVLVAPYRLWNFGYSLAPFALLNALFGALTIRRGASMQERLVRLEQIDQLLDVFEQEDK